MTEALRRIRFVNTMAEVLSGIDNSVEMELYKKDSE